jgi:hypothetical protein
MACRWIVDVGVVGAEEVEVVQLRREKGNVVVVVDAGGGRGAGRIAAAEAEEDSSALVGLRQEVEGSFRLAVAHNTAVAPGSGLEYLGSQNGECGVEMTGRRRTRGRTVPALLRRSYSSLVFSKLPRAR